MEVSHMPRIITTSVTVYKYDELADAAKAKAVEQVQEMFVRTWDSHDVERINETLVYAFAEKLRAPGWDTYSVSDYPGIDGIALLGWDLERGESVEFQGTLNRENAPALPWVDGIESVVLRHPDYWRPVQVETDSEADLSSVIKIMAAAVDTAIRATWEVGRAEMDYLEGDEYAKEWIEGNEPEFHKDGTLYRKS
jgi:hypothetical protein